MKWTSSILLAALLFQIGYVPCAAQEISPGTRVRIKAPSIAEHRVIGTVVTIGADTLTLRTKRQVAPLAIPFASVTEFEVTRGKKRNVGKGAVIGVIVGGLSGAIIGYSTGDDPPGRFSPTSGTPSYIGDIRLTKKQQAMVLGILGSLGGLGWGALIGALKTTDRWEKASLDRLRVGLVPQRRGGLALSTSFSF